MNNKDNNKQESQFGHMFVWDENFKGKLIITLKDKDNKDKSKGE